MRLLIFLFAFTMPLLNLKAQDKHKIDSLTRELRKAKDPEAKFEIYRALSYLDEPRKKYKSSMLLNAELSGSTELQLRTYVLAGRLVNDSYDSAQFYLDKMYALAKEKKNEEYQGWYYLYSGAVQYCLRNFRKRISD